MDKQDYIKELKQTVFKGTKQQESVSRLLAQVDAQISFTDDDKLEIESYARQISILPASKDLPEEDTTSKKDDRRWLPKYDLDDDYKLPCGLKEFGFDESCSNVAVTYGHWLRDTFLPTFLKMPDSEHQYPIVVSLILLNCRAVSNKKMKIPIPYFLGNRGSGKTEMGKVIRQHYPDHLSIQLLPADTGSAMVEKLDEKFRHGEVGVATYDNFNPDIFVLKAMSCYQTILANSEEDSIRRVSSKSNDNGQSEYFTYCYKVFTSVFDLSTEGRMEFGEMYRRMLVMKCKKSAPAATRTAFDWEGQQRVYQRIWGEESRHLWKGAYSKSLRELVRINPQDIPKDIEPEQWEICIVPIAVGIYCGMWNCIEDGIAHFARHFRWLKNNNDTGVGSALTIALTKYIKEDLVKIAEQQKSNLFYPRKNGLAGDVIDQKEVVDYLSNATGYAVSKQDFNEVIGLMSNFGYNYGKVGKSMGFIKESCTV